MRTLMPFELDAVSGGAQALVGAVNPDQAQVSAVNKEILATTSPNATAFTTGDSGVLTVANAEAQKASSAVLAIQLI